jgi:hypothetical protein
VLAYTLAETIGQPTEANSTIIALGLFNIYISGIKNIKKILTNYKNITLVTVTKKNALGANMSISEDNIRINVDLDKDVIKSLDQIRDKLQQTRSTLIKNLILISLHDLNVMKNTGLLFVFNPIKQLLEKIPGIPYMGHKLNKSENTETVSVIIDKGTKELLDKYSERFDLPIKKLTRNLIYTTLDDYNFLSKTGLIRIAYNFKNQLKSDQEFDEKVQHEN